MALATYKHGNRNLFGWLQRLFGDGFSSYKVSEEVVGF
jgi:hypothetical protein